MGRKANTFRNEASNEGFEKPLSRLSAFCNYQRVMSVM
ncbi:hypothetical protein AtDm6_2341 [Acetobacter tropicalis]|uniref:Uncharacterized protein n=1 Tax=Acetobacter tropicalis TaxID=104102 RepID=A0A094YJY0_9PROT|nr:hypothetical protein AtDm6_2341 [Acetobacter tropicalis]